MNYKNKKLWWNHFSGHLKLNFQKWANQFKKSHYIDKTGKIISLSSKVLFWNTLKCLRSLYFDKYLRRNDQILKVDDSSLVLGFI